MLVRFWGTRGSIPSPGPDTARHGGNTSCIEVVSDGGRRLVVDGGTGIRRLGARIAKDGDGSDGHSMNLLLTHCHWDHVQGLPFFEPLRIAGTEIHMRVPTHLASQADRILQTQLDPLFFPITRADLRARIIMEAAREREEIHDVAVRSAAVEHPGGALAYRVSAAMDEGRSVVVAPDSEFAGKQGRKSPLEKLALGARILVHDAMYTEAEYGDRIGWGHSTHLAAVDLALRSHVQLLVLFHHHPDRTDAQVDGLLEECRAAAAEKSADLLVIAAYEGLELEV